MRRIRTITLGVLLFAAIVIQLQAATIIVTNTNDSGSGSLRQALAASNNEDTINFAVTGTITLTSGELLVSKNATHSGTKVASDSIITMIPLCRAMENRVVLRLAS